MKITLRPYQQKGVDECREAFRNGARGVCYVLATGGGKTAVMTNIAESASRKNSRITILVHRQELLTQCSNHLTALGLTHGRITPGAHMSSAPIQVASVQTLVRRLNRHPSPDIIMVDECHHSHSSTYRKIIDHYPKAIILGVTATPKRLDGAGLGTSSGGHYDAMVVGPSTRELIEMGFLTPPTVYAPPTALDMSGVKIVAGEYARGEMSARVDKPSITGSAVHHYKAICPGAPAIAFCASVEHAHHVAAEFNAAGFRAKCLDGTMADTDRKKAIDDLGSGKLDVLTSCDIISEGTDIPRVAVAILLRPTASESLHLQQCGRAMRKYAGKEETIILDHVGNCLRHGLPDDEREWSLEGAKKAKGGKAVIEVKARQCPKCYKVYSPSMEACPKCGFAVEKKAREVMPETVEGELKKLEAEDKARIAKERRQEVNRAKTREELAAIAKERGYNPSWVNIQMNLRKQRGWSS